MPCRSMGAKSARRAQHSSACMPRLQHERRASLPPWFSSSPCASLPTAALTLRAACKYSAGCRPSTGNSLPAGGCSWASTRAAVVKAEMDMPCHADTICHGGGGTRLKGVVRGHSGPANGIPVQLHAVLTCAGTICHGTRQRRQAATARPPSRRGAGAGAWRARQIASHGMLPAALRCRRRSCPPPWPSLPGSAEAARWGRCTLRKTCNHDSRQGSRAEHPRPT